MVKLTELTSKKVRGSTTRRPIMLLFDVLGQRWTLRILWELHSKRQTFRELRSNCEDVSPTILNKRLKYLRELQFIDHNEQGYGYTTIGQELGAKLIELDSWANDWAGPSETS